MSHSYYNEIWLIAREDLEKLLELDGKVQSSKPTKQDAILNLILPTYLRYRNLVKRLVICYNQMLHTQKRNLIQRVLDCCIGRMLEYKRELIKLQFTDYQWPDNFLNQLKFTPDDLEIPTPVTGKERLEERQKYIKELMESSHRITSAIRERSLSTIYIESVSDVQETASKRSFRRRRVRDSSGSKTTISPGFMESPDEIAAREARLAAKRKMHSAMVLIQSHERARMARCTANDAKKLYDYNKKLMTGEAEQKKVPKSRCKEAAITIQRTWRRYAARKARRKRMARLEDLLGMTLPSWTARDVHVTDEDNFKARVELMPKFAAQTEKAISDERTKLLRIKGPGLMEDITDEIREWFLIWYNELGHFDVYPAANLGGSVLVATGQTLTPQEYLAEKLAKEKEGGKKAKDKKQEKTEKKGKKTKGEGVKWNMPKSQAYPSLISANNDFIENWKFRDESANHEQKEYLDLITDKLCCELQLEVREIVDELMRLELQKLNEALVKDHADDPTKFVIPMLEKDKKKKKGGGKKKKKGKKDALADVPVDELFTELVQARIIRNYPVTRLKDWIGDLSYQNYEAKREFREYKHRLGEIKQVVMDSCVLPLSSKEAHQIAPLTRSVCICGLDNSGKNFLGNAICSEAGALMFDMTPHVLRGKYLNKKNQQRLIDMISKVARIYAPSIIFIDGGEKPWLKTVPMEEKHYQPKRFAPYYPKLVKSIKPGDQILFLTLSAEPYKATRPFIKIHDKFIIIPLTDYNTLFMYYKYLLMKYHGVDRNIDVSCLAKMSVGVPLEFIRQSVENVLNLNRRITLKFNPLSPKEIMDEVVKYKLPPAKTLSQFEKFEARTPLGKKRKKLLAAEKAAWAAGKGKPQKPRR